MYFVKPPRRTRHYLGNSYFQKSLRPSRAQTHYYAKPATIAKKRKVIVPKRDQGSNLLLQIPYQSMYRIDQQYEYRRIQKYVYLGSSRKQIWSRY